MVQMALDRLETGDHVCWTFGLEGELLDAVTGFVGRGLAQRYKVVYLSQELLPSAVIAGLDARGVPATSAARAGQLEVTLASGLFLANGQFDPHRSLAALERMITTASNEGWQGLRIAGDMSWAATGRPGPELVWFEAQYNRLSLAGATTVCFYDRRPFTSGEIDQVAAAHPGTRGPGVGDQWLPQLRVRRTRDQAGLRLIGQVDLANRQVLPVVFESLLAELPADAGPVTVEVSQLSFADAATAYLLVRTARAHPAGMRLVGCSPILAKLIELVAGRSPVPITLEGS